MCSVTSAVKMVDGHPVLYQNDKPVPGMAYMTYRMDNSCYDDFAALGYQLYSMPVFFAAQTINETPQPEPFAPGIFDSEVPDFGLFDRDVQKILDACPEAYIFPRVNISVTKAWEKAHPEELNDTGTERHPESRRACFSSDLWAEEVKRMLRLFIAHVEEMPWREHIVGYQIAGGNTEEWFPYDMKGSIGLRTRERYAEYLTAQCLTDSEEVWYRFLSEVTASRVCEFAACVKELTEHRLIVGVFYGYTFECSYRESTHHDLMRVLECQDIDFISSPVSYMGGRSVGEDHAYMLPLESLKLHGKLYFSENDTRTHLSRALNDMPHYNQPIWFGPDIEKSCEILKMHFAKALVNRHACWWFDMWGGWYADDRYRKLMEQFRILSERETERRTAPDAPEGDGRQNGLTAEIAVFVDEKAYAGMESGGVQVAVCSGIRSTLGRMGAPYDKYLAEDFEAVADQYRAVISLVPRRTEGADRIRTYCREHDVALLEITAENAGITTKELRAFASAAGVHLYIKQDAAVYAGGDYLFLHLSENGTYEVQLPTGDGAEEVVLYEVFREQEMSPVIKGKKGESYLFRL